MSGQRFSPFITGRCYHWICAEESVARLWSSAGELWLLTFVSIWSKGGDSAGQDLSKGAVWFLLPSLQHRECYRAAPEASRFQVILPVCDQSKQERCSPSCAIVCDFVSAVLQHSRWREKSVSLDVQQRISNFSLVLPINIAVNQVSFKGEQRGQRSSLAEDTWQLLHIPISRCGGFSSISLTCLV